MKLFVDNDWCIKDVGSTERTDVTEVYVDETVEDFFFKDKSTDFICSYKVNVDDNGYINMVTPYVDSKALPHIEEQGQKNDDMKMAAMILLGEVEA